MTTKKNVTDEKNDTTVTDEKNPPYNPLKPLNHHEAIHYLLITNRIP